MERASIEELEQELDELQREHNELLDESQTHRRELENLREMKAHLKAIADYVNSTIYARES